MTTPSDKPNKNTDTAYTSVDRQARLTQIGQQLKSQHSDDGFQQAKEDIEQALQQNKIVLKQRFVLEQAIGAGGMGAVYLAQDLRKVEASDINSRVAVKVLNGDFKQHPDALIALQREASRSANLSHPNIVTVYDFDRDGDTVYMTMEFLDGEDLDAMMRRLKPELIHNELAEQIILDILRALHHAHQKGIIHCDLKPANIFVTQDGAKVLDFGIARLARKEIDHFDAGRIGALTPDYATVEMLKHESPSPKDDVFAAAVIAYEILSGSHPFEHKPALIAQTMGITPKPIEGLPKHQWKAIAQALELDAEKRTSDALTFLKQFKGPKNSSLLSFAAIGAVAIAAVGYFWWQGESVKNRFNLVMAEAESCWNLQDYECSVEKAQIALNLQPSDSEADDLLAKANEALEQQDLEAKIDDLLILARGCINSEDYSCAKNHSNELLLLNPSLNEAIEIKSIADDELMKQKQAYESAFTDAENCLAKQQLSCAEEAAARAQSIMQDDPELLPLLSKIDAAKQQRIANLQKARQIVTEGTACFDRFDYSCAIAKAESALEFVERYGPAVELKQKAEKAIEDAKKAINIE